MGAIKRVKPRPGQKFRAYNKIERIGREHFGSPFKCTKLYLAKGRVDGVDKFGLKVALKFSDFTFELIKRKKKRKKKA